MKSLSQASEDTLNTLKEKKNNTSLTPQAGSTQGVGTMNTALANREAPLTEKELTQIASRMLLKPLSIAIVKKPIYGKKTAHDQYGGYEADEVIGHEDYVEVTLLFRDNKTQQLIEAALRHSPAAATTKHLTHLAIHKRLGSNEKDRAILLRDYTEALRPYSDWIIYSVCKFFWEGHDSDFYPKIAVLRASCEAVHQQVTALHTNLLGYRAPRAERDDKKNDLRREQCDYLASKGKPDPYDDTVMTSNYMVEMLAKSFGWRADGSHKNKT